MFCERSCGGRGVLAISQNNPLPGGPTDSGIYNYPTGSVRGWKAPPPLLSLHLLLLFTSFIFGVKAE